MTERFLDMCELHSFIGFCVWCGDLAKASEATERLSKIAEGHAVLNFIARHLWMFFV